MKGLIFDDKLATFKEAERSFWSVLRSVFWFLLVTLVLSALYYVILSAFVSTDTERRLRRENRMYSRIYPQMEERRQLLEDVVENLQVRDNSVYEQIFHAGAPAVDPVNTLDLLKVSDTLADRHIVEYTSRKADRLFSVCDSVEASFAKVFAIYDAPDEVLPPLSLPLEKASFAQMGASTGNRINPFYKVPMDHKGLDIIASRGDAVVASGDGVVSGVTLSRKGQGNVVEITHPGGYVTRYCHLGDVNVRKGTVVRRGRRIGEVGMSGNAFAPHLHYEILRDGEHVDPINYFFASVTPDEYANMVFMSEHTRQSMD